MKRIWRKNIKKIFTNTGVALALGSASTAYAAKYDTNSYASFIGNYRIDLDGNGVFEPDYTGTYHKADGYMYTTDYEDIKKNTYTVNVNTNSDLAPRCLQIRGNGEIIQ